MTSTSPLHLVNKSAPGRSAGGIDDVQYKAMCDFFYSGRQSRHLLSLLNELHANKQWLVCNCVDPETPLTERPALTVARSPKGSLYLRNIAARMEHSTHCPFSYVPAPIAERTEVEEPEQPLNPLAGSLRLHQPAATEVAGNGSGTGQGTRKITKGYPRLGQVLIHLMMRSGMLTQGSSFDFLGGIRDIRQSASELQAFPGMPLDEVLCLSVKHEQDFIERITELRERNAGAYGVMVTVVHEVESSPAAMVRKDKSGNIEWRCEPRGEFIVWGRRSISKGPFIAAITYAPSTTSQEVRAQHAFALPILSNTRPLPVESDIERQAARALVRLIEWAEKTKRMRLELIKPMYDLDVGIGLCRPDFIVKGPGGQAVIEVMGMIDDPDYMARKAKTHPLMREIGALIEVCPPVDAEALKGMNKEVLKHAGWKTQRPRRPGQVK